jgi:predicted DNA-binding protein
VENKKDTPQKRWDKKNGYISKSFRMYQDIADRFKEACDKANRPQASVITELMEEFIKRQEAE